MQHPWIRTQAPASMEMMHSCVMIMMMTTMHAWHVSGEIFNIMDHGAAANGKTDAAAAVAAAWSEACGRGGATVLVPAGTFLVGQVALRGPCKGTISFINEGLVRAPADPGRFSGEYWISFEQVQQLTVSGRGTFDGQGAVTWSRRGSCSSSPDCGNAPVNLRFDSVARAKIEGISSLNSKFFHILISDSKHVRAQFISVKSPENSPNTDGIHITRSTDVLLSHSDVKYGDDCVSIGPGAIGLVVENVTCGPGHGISVGSLGRYQEEADVRNVTVRNCTVSGTQNGVRIKTWRSNYASSVSNVTFHDVFVEKAYNPIVIDQNYCPHGSCDDQPPSRVSIRGVNFWNIRGTSATETAVSLMCSSAKPCNNVDLRDVKLSYSGGKGPVCQCSNVHPISSGVVTPACKS